MRTKVLITGGAGFIGSRLAMKCVEAGHHVIVLDNLLPQIHGENPTQTSYTYNLIRDKVDFYLGDVRDRNILEELIREVDYVFHLAAETGTGQSMYEISRYTEVNVQATANLMDVLCNQEHSVKKLILSSTRALYGEGKYFCSEHGIVYPNSRSTYELELNDWGCKCPHCQKNVKIRPTDEQSQLSPNSVYGITKLAQENLILTVGKSLNINTYCLRYQNVYGPGQSLKNPYTGILSIFSNEILDGNDINIFEDGEESRDFVFVDDVVDATYSFLTNEDVLDGVYNVGSGNSKTVMDVAKNLVSAYAKSADNKSISLDITGNYRVGDIRHNIADISKINLATGWSPKVSFEEGIKAFTKWVMSQERSKSKYLDSLDEMAKKGLFKR